MAKATGGPPATGATAGPRPPARSRLWRLEASSPDEPVPRIARDDGRVYSVWSTQHPLAQVQPLHGPCAESQHSEAVIQCFAEPGHCASPPQAVGRSAGVCPGHRMQSSGPHGTSHVVTFVQLAHSARVSCVHDAQFTYTSRHSVPLHSVQHPKQSQPGRARGWQYATHSSDGEVHDDGSNVADHSGGHSSSSQHACQLHPSLPPPASVSNRQSAMRPPSSQLSGMPRSKVISSSSNATVHSGSLPSTKPSPSLSTQSAHAARSGTQLVASAGPGSIALASMPAAGV